MADNESKDVMSYTAQIERIDNLIAGIEFFIPLIEQEGMSQEYLEDCITELENYRQKLVRDLYD